MYHVASEDEAWVQGVWDCVVHFPIRDLTEEGICEWTLFGLRVWVVSTCSRLPCKFWQESQEKAGQRLSFTFIYEPKHNLKREKQINSFFFLPDSFTGVAESHMLDSSIGDNHLPGAREKITNSFTVGDGRSAHIKIFCRHRLEVGPPNPQH